jgi:hypothetical protein
MTEAEIKSFVDIATLVVLALTLIVVLWQAFLIRRTLEADTFASIEERAEGIDLSQTADLINSWTFNNYATYETTVAPDDQARVRKLVDFLNDVSHLARAGYINDYYPIRLYAPVILTCGRKLLPWWADGLRAKRSYKFLYNNFEYFYRYAEYWESHNYPRKGYRWYLRTIEHVAEL